MTRPSSLRVGLAKLTALIITVLIAVLAGTSAGASHRLQSGRNPDELVRQLGEFPASFPGIARSDGSPDLTEERRWQLYSQLIGLGAQALPALTRGLAQPDVQVRRNVALFQLAAAGTSSPSSQPRLDTQACLPALVSALQDSDARVRELSAQAIGEIGPKAALAVPGLVRLLTSPEEGSRNSACIGLAGIGPAAKEALAALRNALSDPSADVRSFAQRAIGKIEAR
jgi:HEAT repeat protein